MTILYVLYVLNTMFIILKRDTFRIIQNMIFTSMKYKIINCGFSFKINFNSRKYQTLCRILKQFYKDEI